MSKYQLKIEKDFNLDHIFDCGQCFRWKKEEDGSYTGIAFGKCVNMAYEDGVLTITGATADDYENIWRDYLDMDTDYSKIKAAIDIDQKIKDYGYGIRILNQDSWETLISFIVSQNNNISRIKGCIEKMCQLCGEKIEGGYAFPTPEKLMNCDLTSVRLGYREKYILDTARRVHEEGFVDRENIEKYLGVGPKVANCINLFGLRKYDSFPIDTWMEKIMASLYGLKTKKQMAAFAADHFGSYGGYAQQYLFYYARNLDELK
ncbi:MAG: 8-oxoguanine DNA glycosylase [Clostridia bacterium]|nr:8-oxoguanine DNA glycosylase [Clostridia bacterium]